MVTRTTIAMLVLLALALGAGAVAVQSRTVSGPVYTVAQLQASFARHPRTWIGRSVLVHGNVSRYAVTTLCSSRGCQPQTQQWLVMEAPQVFRSGWAHLDQPRTAAWPCAGPRANRPPDRRSGASAARGPLSARPTTHERCPPPPSRIRPELRSLATILMRQCRAAGAMSRTTAS